jgi:hypothetical protein
MPVKSWSWEKDERGHIKMPFSMIRVLSVQDLKVRDKNEL